MTIRDAMLLLIDKTDRAMDAVKILRSIDAGSPVAEGRARKLIAIAIGEQSTLTDDDKLKLSQLIQKCQYDDPPRRTEVVRFRVTPNEKSAINLLASKYANGNMSKLIMDALNSKYPTL